MKKLKEFGLGFLEESELINIRLIRLGTAWAETNKIYFIYLSIKELNVAKGIISYLNKSIIKPFL